MVEWTERISKYRNALILAIILMFVLLIGFYVLAVQPVRTEDHAQQEEISLVTEENARMQEKIASLNAAAQENAANGVMDQALPAVENTEQIIRDFKTISEKTSISLKDVQFTIPTMNHIRIAKGDEKSPFPSVKEVNMTATIQGNLTQIRAWMDELQKLPRLLVVDSFTFEKPYEVSPPGSIIDANVSFTAYYQPNTK
ncbi:type IV pilus assembly protein PilO [Paenibacillus shirakamiensis]|uniref:Type IV pilus assembly protein PilO n=1 Tax=Paenibacillus shirakamiensis TaxID=1265935 RepID=A0ABS4JKI4_9BACL|nr:hypothetical protein [Paenibacillus shirakamiensis]MBP2001580.1 type IV pilus assembly protein PilO [Paenibacillus shirakamiensis]